MLSEYSQSARRCSADNAGYEKYLEELTAIEVGKRESNAIARRIQAARLPAMKELADFNFAAVPSLNKAKVLELAKCTYIHSHTNVVLVGPPGVGKTHIAIVLTLAACRSGLNARFTIGKVNSTSELSTDQELPLETTSNHMQMTVDETL